MRIKDVEKRLNEEQDEYQELLLNWTYDFNEETIETKHYKWRRLKELQKNIIINTLRVRDMRLEDTKEALEKAFTPELKSMLSQSLSEKND